MLYHRRTNNFKKLFSVKKFSITIFFVILIILIETINPEGVTKPIQSIALLFSSVKNNIENNISNIFSILKSKEKLAEENRNLSKQYSLLNTDCSLLINNLKSKQDELEKSLGRKNSSLKNFIASGYVIAKPPVAPYGTIMIDIGSSSGLKIGDLAIVSEYLIGTISNIENDRATIKLYGEKNDSLSILVGEKRLLLSGEGGGLGTFKTRIANESKILTGENVRLSNYPQYIFGNIISANQSSNDQYQDLTVKSPINIFELSSVDIVSK